MWSEVDCSTFAHAACLAASDFRQTTPMTINDNRSYAPFARNDTRTHGRAHSRPYRRVSSLLTTLSVVVRSRIRSRVRRPCASARSRTGNSLFNFPRAQAALASWCAFYNTCSVRAHRAMATYELVIAALSALIAGYLLTGNRRRTIYALYKTLPRDVL